MALYPNAVCEGNINHVSTAARTDYAINSGTTLVSASGSFTDFATVDAGGFVWPNMSAATGVSFGTSEVTMAQIQDGTSCTYLVGDKSLNPDYYFGTSGAGDPSDEWPIFGGYNSDYNRYGWSNEAKSCSATRPRGL